VVAAPPYRTTLSSLVATATPHRSVTIVAPTIDEVEEIAADLSQTCDRPVVTAHSGLTGRDLTAAWTRAATDARTCLVGTREIALWPVAAAGLVVVVEDARRAMRSPSTPTIGVRDVLIERCRRDAVPLTTVGPIPSLEMVERGARIGGPQRRWWPLVEVADRSEEPPSASPVLERTRAAIAHTVREGGRAFVLVPRRGHAATVRCASCGALRRCPACRSAWTGEETCVRCGASPAACESCGGDRWRSVGAGRGNVIDDLHRVVGADVGDRSAGRPVIVGTERDLVGMRGMALAVAVDVDGMAGAPHYRAAEDALGLLARLAHTLEPGRGRRCLLQTSDPDQPVVATLRSGDPGPFIREELAARRRAGFPPFGELIALEVADDDAAPPLVVEALDGLATVLGPAPSGDRLRWLIRGRDLAAARIALRRTVATIRDRGGRVRVDVDPRDL
jgi:primosomal protein N' (replication factor Y)